MTKHIKTNNYRHHTADYTYGASQVAQWERIHLPVQEMQETQVRSLGWEDPLQEEGATHSSIPAWKIPWTEEPGGLQPNAVGKSQTQLRETAHGHSHPQLGL